MANKYAEFSKVKKNCNFKWKRVYGSANGCIRKKAFDSKPLAEQFHEKNKKHYEDAKLQKAYKCRHCLMWHLTSIKDKRPKQYEKLAQKEG